MASLKMSPFALFTSPFVHTLFIAVVGSGSMVGGIIGEKAGELTGEFIYEVTRD